MAARKSLLTVVVPAYNEAANVQPFFRKLLPVLEGLDGIDYEVVAVDDGSVDGTLAKIRTETEHNSKIRLIRLSKNFGKELALTAGIRQAKGDAVLMMDIDGQHPVERIPDFVEAWRDGSEVVVGVRRSNSGEGWVKRWGSKLFYFLVGKVTGVKMTAGTTDFCLIDSVVRDEFVQINEANRMTRAIIGWLGYERREVEFAALPREYGMATYSFGKLVRLALDSMISMSISPLYVATYVGLAIVPMALLLGLGMVVEGLLGDPMGLNITGTAYLAVLLVLLVGILLVSQGILGLYLSHIHVQTQSRPLYVIDRRRSVGVRDDES